MKKKEYLQGLIEKDEYNKFIYNSFIEFGPKNGFKGKGLSVAVKVYNAFFKKIEGFKFSKVAEESGLKPIELIETILEKTILFHRISHNKGIDLSIDEITVEAIEEIIEVLNKRKELIMILIPLLGNINVSFFWKDMFSFGAFVACTLV